MKKILIIFFLINFNNFAFGAINKNIVNKLQNINNLIF